MLQACSLRCVTRVCSQVTPLLHTASVNTAHCRHTNDYQASSRLSQTTPFFHNPQTHSLASPKWLHKPWTSLPTADHRLYARLPRDHRLSAHLPRDHGLSAHLPRDHRPYANLPRSLSSSSHFHHSLYRDSFKTVSVRELHKQESRKQAEHLLSAQGIVRASPLSWQPYMRLMRIDRPIGTWLLYLPCTWSISLASSAGHLPDPSILALFALGSFFMRGAGCTINDMWDRDFDAKVARTQDRPLACGEIKMLRALVFLAAQLSVSLAILLTFNWYTIVLGACSLIPCIIYPLMKRVTYWPQVFLGITLNWGVLISWGAIQGSVSVAGALLYMACALQTIIYDTIYSHQDKDDDILIGVKSTALGLGENTKPWLAGFSVAMVSGLTTAGVLCDQTWPYYAGVAYITAHLTHQIFTVDLDDAEDCGRKFRSHRNIGFVFWAAIMLGTYLKGDTDKGDQMRTEVSVE